MNGERNWAILLGAAAVGARMYLGGRYALDPDECMHFSAGSAGQWFQFHHPPLTFWWVWAAALVSEREWWLRLGPAVAGGLAPVALLYWMKRFLTPGVAWAMAGVAAFAPALVWATAQVRGYGFLLLGAAGAAYLLERAFAERSRGLLGAHFGALVLGILASFSMAWVVAAMGLYGVARLWREEGTRRLAGWWVAGQGLAAGLYVWLYWAVVKPLAEHRLAKELVEVYLAGTFPRAEEGLAVFFAKGVVKQFLYLAGSVAAGLAATVLLAAGLWVWARRGEARGVLVGGLFLAVLGAIGGFHPFGKTRHTAVIGVLSLAGVGAGIEQLGGRRRWVAMGALGVAMAGGWMETWREQGAEGRQVERMAEARARLWEAIPAGAVVLADKETVWMMQVWLMPREARGAGFGETARVWWKGTEVRAAAGFDWGRYGAEQIRGMARGAGREVWVVDMGFKTAALRGWREELELGETIDLPGTVFAGRLR